MGIDLRKSRFSHRSGCAFWRQLDFQADPVCLLSDHILQQGRPQAGIAAERIYCEVLDKYKIAQCPVSQKSIERMFF